MNESLLHRDSDGTEVVSIVLHPGDEAKAEDGHFTMADQREHFLPVKSERDTRPNGSGTATFPADLAQREDRRPKQFAPVQYPGTGSSVQQHSIVQRDGDDEDQSQLPPSKRMYGMNNGNRGMAIPPVTGHSRVDSNPSFRRRFVLPQRVPTSGQDTNGGQPQHISGGDFSSGKGLVGQLDSASGKLPTPIRPALPAVQVPPLLAADPQPSQSTLLSVGPVGENGETPCVFCSRQIGSVVCLGTACCAFLNGKLPVLCGDCSTMLHTHHPNHRLFFCHQPPASAVHVRNNDCLIQTPSEDSCHDSHASPPGSPHMMKAAKMPARGRSKSTKLELLESVHQRYMTILYYFMENPSTSMIDAYKATGVSRTTLQDNRWITELKLVDVDRYNDLMSAMLNEEHLPRLSLISIACQEVLSEEMYSTRIAQMRASRQLLPFTPILNGTLKSASTHLTQKP